MRLEIEHFGRKYRAVAFVYKDFIELNSFYGCKTFPREGDPEAQATAVLHEIVSAYREFYCG